MTKLLFDQGMPLGAARSMRERGWDAIHVREVEMQQAEDKAIFDRAATDQRVVITLDKDFPDLAAKRGTGLPSIVLLRLEGQNAQRAVDLLEPLLHRLHDDLRAGCIVTVNAQGVRVRGLPIRGNAL